MTLGFCTGYRISELLSLTISDVLTNGTTHSHAFVKAANTKTKVVRTATLNTDAKKALKNLVDWLEQKGMDKTTPLFVSRKHTNGFAAISRQQAHKLLKDLFALAGEFGNVSPISYAKPLLKRFTMQQANLN